MSLLSSGRRRYRRDWRVATAAVAAIAVVGGAAAVAPHLTGHAAEHAQQVGNVLPGDGGSGSYNGTVSTSNQQGAPGPGATVYDYTPGNVALDTNLPRLGGPSSQPLPDGTQVSIQCYWTGAPVQGPNGQGQSNNDGFWDQINSSSAGMPGQLSGNGNDFAVVPDAYIDTGTDPTTGAVKTVDQIVNPCNPGSGGTGSQGTGNGSQPGGGSGSGGTGSQGAGNGSQQPAAPVAPGKPGGVPAATGTGPCTDVEVVFVRGTSETANDFGGLGFPGGYVPSHSGDPGLGLVPALQQEPKLAGKSISFYAVDYNTDANQTHTVDAAHIMETWMKTEAMRCPDTQFVVGGYSQGAAAVDVALGLGHVLAPAYAALYGAEVDIRQVQSFGSATMLADDLANDPGLPASLAGRIVAVVTFGNPIHWANQSPQTASQLYGAKWADFCIAGDPVCANGLPWSHILQSSSVLDIFFHAHEQYHLPINGDPSDTQQAAQYAASRVATGVSQQVNAAG